MRADLDKKLAAKATQLLNRLGEADRLAGVASPVGRRGKLVAGGGARNVGNKRSRAA